MFSWMSDLQNYPTHNDVRTQTSLKAKKQSQIECTKLKFFLLKSSHFEFLTYIHEEHSYCATEFPIKNIRQIALREYTVIPPERLSFICHNYT